MCLSLAYYITQTTNRTAFLTHSSQKFLKQQGPVRCLVLSIKHPFEGMESLGQHQRLDPAEHDTTSPIPTLQFNPKPTKPNPKPTKPNPAPCSYQRNNFFNLQTRYSRAICCSADNSRCPHLSLKSKTGTWSSTCPQEHKSKAGTGQRSPPPALRFVTNPQTIL